MKEIIALGGEGIFSFLIVIFNDFYELHYDVLSSFRLYNIQFKKVKILWGRGLGAEGRVLDMRARGREPDNLKTRCKILKNLKLNLKPKQMLLFIVPPSHYCEFKFEHAFPNQSFSPPPFDHHYVLPDAF